MLPPPTTRAYSVRSRSPGQQTCSTANRAGDRAEPTHYSAREPGETLLRG